MKMSLESFFGNLSTDPFHGLGTPLSSLTTEHTTLGPFSTVPPSGNMSDSGGGAIPGGDMEGSGVSMSYLREDPWVVPLLAAACTNAAAIVAFEVYVVVSAVRGTPSRRHLFLGQCLMMGLLLCSLSGLPIALVPTPLTCAITRLLIGVSCALIFAALLVKCVFLISLNSGVYLPAHYQALLLFFIVLVQLSVSIQWLVSSPADVVVLRDTSTGMLATTCAAPYREFLLSLVYVIILIIVVAALSVKCRGIRENYREASYIGASMGLVLPLWLSWTLAGLILPRHAQPACLGFGVVATAAVIFIIMFVPKGRQLSAVGKDGLYREDRDDNMSTLSAARYSPSFFIFKPIKPSYKPTKDIIRPANFVNSIYKTHISDMFGYGVLPPQPPPHPLPPPAPHYWPVPHYYHHYYPGFGRSMDEGVYTSIDRPQPPEYGHSNNPNFYLFRSHAHPGMMY